MSKTIDNYSTNEQNNTRIELGGLVRTAPIPNEELIENLGLYIPPKDLSRILCFDFLYRQIIDVQGVILDFGCRYGNELMVFSSLRSIYEPFNRHRLVVGFDTFEGFPKISEKDGHSSWMKEGGLAIPEEAKHHLLQCVCNHRHFDPHGRFNKTFIYQGKAEDMLPRFFEEHPHVIVALAFFDFDIYDPTKKCLELLQPRLTKGSVLAFDQLNDQDSPGETLALMETFGLRNVTLKRFPATSRISYFYV